MVCTATEQRDESNENVLFEVSKATLQNLKLKNIVFCCVV